MAGDFEGKQQNVPNTHRSPAELSTHPLVLDIRESHRRRRELAMRQDVTDLLGCYFRLTV